MKKALWKKSDAPFYVLAPMADVTDPAFRRIIARYGKPDVMWTEFVSADGLFSKGSAVVSRDLEYSDEEHPIVAQFFSARVDMMERAANEARERMFDGVDINMGCPDKNVEKQHCGADLIRHPSRACDLIHAAKNAKLPVSVKTRLGYSSLDEWSEWIGALLNAHPSLITIHLRTRKEMSLVPAHWEYMSKICALRDEISPDTLIFGNGDVSSLKEAKEKVSLHRCDGVMLGRGIFGNPWLFSGEDESPSLTTVISVLSEHIVLFEEYLGDIKNFHIMKKHFKAYLHGFDGAKEMRKILMETNTSDEALAILKKYKEQLST